MKPTKEVSVRKISALFLFLFLSGTTAGWANTDFFGIKMRSANHAGGLVIEQTHDNTLKYTHDANTMDDRVRAWGKLTYSGTGRYGGVKITVENRTDTAIPTDLSFLDFTIVTAGGDRHELGKPGTLGLPAEIEPGKKVTFEPSFGSLRVKKADIKMIICSFDMEGTQVVLLPRPYTKPVKERFVNPGEAAGPAKTPKPACVRTRDDAAYPAANFALPKKDRRQKFVR